MGWVAWIRRNSRSSRAEHCQASRGTTISGGLGGSYLVHCQPVHPYTIFKIDGVEARGAAREDVNVVSAIGHTTGDVIGQASDAAHHPGGYCWLR